MKKTYSFFLAFFLTVIAHGQNYIQFPTQNAQWNCTYYQGWWNATNDHGSNTDIITYITNGDSIINNITYTKIFANSTTVLYWVYPDTIFYNSSTGPGYDYIGAMRNDSI